MPRRPDVPCAGCGRLLWRGPTSSAEPICHPCRRKRPGYRDHEARKRDQSFNCLKCGESWTRLATRGNRPLVCDSCRRYGGVRVPAAVRRAIYDRDGWSCGICQDPVDPALIGSRSEWRPSLDHIVPHVHGGDDSPDNLRLAHFWCNLARGAGRYADEDFRVA